MPITLKAESKTPNIDKLVQGLLDRVEAAAAADSATLEDALTRCSRVLAAPVEQLQRAKYVAQQRFLEKKKSEFDAEWEAKLSEMKGDALTVLAGD